MTQLGQRPTIINTHPLVGHRIAAAENNYPQIPVREKRGGPNWPRQANDVESIRREKIWRDTYYTGTGIRLEGDLCAIDIDVTIQRVVDRMHDVLYDLDPDAHDNAIHRDSGAASTATFMRCREPFSRRATRKYTAHPEVLEELAAARKLPETTEEERRAKDDLIRDLLVRLEPQFVEFWGPAANARQFQYDGRHSDGRDFHCWGNAPWNWPRENLSYLPLGPGEICDRLEQVLIDEGLTLIPETESPAAAVQYTLTPETMFYPKDGEPDQIQNLTAGMDYGAEHGIYGCLPETRHSKSRANCKLFVSVAGHVVVSDWSHDGAQYRMKDDEPTQVDTEALAEALRGLQADSEPETPETPPDEAEDDSAIKLPKLQYSDLVGHSPTGKFIYRPTKDLWPVATIDKRLSKVRLSDEVKISASMYIMRTAVVEQMTWIPGEPEFIEDTVMLEGGLARRKGARIYNLYKAPIIHSGESVKARRWIDHVHMVYEDADALRLIRYFGHTAQFPGVKINHALLMGGAPGIGKDTIIAPLRFAVGAWNFAEVRPAELFGRFNRWQRAVVLRINEMHDLGDESMFSLYERLKMVTAAPPEVLPIDDKHIPTYYVPNVVKVIETTNYRENGVYLPPDDRRTDVMWSPLKTDDRQGEQYFTDFHMWLESEGNRHVAAYLRELDLKDFNPKAPPLKTDAFWSIVNASRSPTDTGIGDIIEAMSKQDGFMPGIITVSDLRGLALNMRMIDVHDWLTDQKHRRHIPANLEKHGYVEVANPDAADRRWRLEGRKQAIYRHVNLSLREAMGLIERRISGQPMSEEVAEVLKNMPRS